VEKDGLMAWTVPATVVTDQLMTAALWNQQIQADQIELRAGGIAVASQAAGDLLRTSSPSQVGRVAAANGIPYFSGGAWSFQSIVGLVYPVDCVYISDDSTNPGTLFGVGTWAVIASGRVLYGLDAAQVEFDVVEETGGAKTVTLVTGELPVHNHGVNDPGHTHQIGDNETGGEGTSPSDKNNPRNYPSSENVTMQTVTTGVTFGSTGGGGAHNNLSPYQVVHMFKRTA